jgi:outer membrane protein OmpA-like peptidoglycan-associated protein
VGGLSGYCRRFIHGQTGARLEERRWLPARPPVFNGTQDVLTATFKSEVLFDFDSAALKPGAYPEIDRVTGVLNNYPQTTIRVEGHTDSIGSETYNQQLSERRAEAVRKCHDSERSGSREKITAIGYGESQTHIIRRCMNRRVNIVIMPM